MFVLQSLCEKISRQETPNTSLRAIPTLHTHERPLQQIPPHPRDFDSKFDVGPFPMICCRARMAKRCFKPISSLLASNNYLHMADHNIGSVNKSQAPSKQKPEGGLNEVAYSQPKATQKHHPFRASGYTQNVKRQPNCAPGGTLSKTSLASCSGAILAGSWRAVSARYWPNTRRDPPAKGSQRGTRRDPLGYLAATGGLLWWDTTGELLWRDSAGSTGELLWDTQRDTRRNPLAGCSGGDPLASCSGGILGGIHWRDALAGYSAGSTGEQLWRDTGRDPLARCSGGILGGMGDLLAGTRLDPLASSFGGILGGIHWRAALAGYSRDTGRGRGVEASQTRIRT